MKGSYQTICGYRDDAWLVRTTDICVEREREAVEPSAYCPMTLNEP